MSCRLLDWMPSRLKTMLPLVMPVAYLRLPPREEPITVTKILILNLRPVKLRMCRVLNHCPRTFQLELVKFFLLAVAYNAATSSLKTRKRSLTFGRSRHSRLPLLKFGRSILPSHYYNGPYLLPLKTFLFQWNAMKELD